MWNYETLDKFGNTARGRSQCRPRNDPSLFGGAYPFIQTGDVKKSDLYISTFSQTYNENGLKQSKLWNEGTLCITIAANIADTGILGIKACFPDSIMGFIPNEETDVRFVKYSFDILQQYCQQISRGTTQDNLSWAKLSRIKFPKPPLPTQQKIASILSAYDNLIQNYKKQIEDLQTTASELYKEWFVRFRFPGYKTAQFENGIPVGWKVEKLFDVANILYGYPFNSDEFCSDSSLNPIVRIRDILDNHTDTYTSEVCDEKYWINPNEMLIGMDGIFHMTLWTGERALQNQRTVRITSKKENLSNYYLYFSLYPQIKALEQMIVGTTVAHLGDKHLKKITILIPDENILKMSFERFEPMMNRIYSLQQQITNLTQQRDLLLPRLMSGKLEVK